jgi:hypothetical protein
MNTLKTFRIIGLIGTILGVWLMIEGRFTEGLLAAMLGELIEVVALLTEINDKIKK